MEAAMRRFTVFATLGILAILGSACDNETPLGPDEAELEEISDLEEHRFGGFEGGHVRVMTRNVYVGADVDPIVEAAAAGASIEEIAGLVNVAFETLVLTNYPERAGAFADEIKRHRPHLVGLQEISTIEAGPIALDFLQILLDELAARNLDYRVAGIVNNIDAMIPGGPAGLVRLADFDVVLARGDVEITNVQEQNYWAGLAFELGGVPLNINRGWVAVDAKIGKGSYRFFNTHLEPAVPEIQLLQVAELMDTISNVNIPAILVGDLNTWADGSGTSTYGMLKEAGYVDIWEKRVGRYETGLTCCHVYDLMNPTQEFDRRIDFILVKNAQYASHRFAIGPARAWVVGDEPRDRTPSGLWPSDHAGLVAQFRLPAARHYASR
jgi:endonuclease/exonuclease/phosphatase family metal-dependent hydrolase